ncbi:uncharacterized protein BYT42DRAFT_572788 [Radiomyces spectabilis]|uniref:uncharacterized protein n=1 Tax=Radiomyces spectabilis TaxID=64574 RepID=UPI00221EEFC3|nr:uncharacterized protein BYT42DRAFT_572788 [Radiomyces spectabilis]KAI8375921.1 hypothetical protein BYT42DRAFT_572788 [Radiomyces spectabilis]
MVFFWSFFFLGPLIRSMGYCIWYGRMYGTVFFICTPVDHIWFNLLSALYYASGKVG